jgi:hypothetical protein
VRNVDGIARGILAILQGLPTRTGREESMASSMLAGGAANARSLWVVGGRNGREEETKREYGGCDCLCMRPGDK